MATTNYTSYENLADITILSPFPGSGSILLMFVVCFVFWIVFHVKLINAENKHYDEIKRRGFDSSSADKMSE